MTDLPSKKVDEPVLYSDPLIHYRMWKLEQKDNLLYPMFYNEPWLPGKEVKSSCQSGNSHRAPESSCSCGLYAIKEFKGLKQFPSYTGGIIDQYGEIKFDDLIIVGAVSLWGKVVEYTEGAKAEYAYPYEFYVPKVLDNYLRPALEPYGVDVVSFECEEILKNIVCNCRRCRDYDINSYEYHIKGMTFECETAKKKVKHAEPERQE